MNLRRFRETAQAFLSGGNARRVVVAMWDIDGLRALNSKHGHAVGDQAVRWVAHRLSVTLGAAGLVARYGGNEFAVLLCR
jgi:diguanylate cyclase (GGDEF)-like protein